jgi:tripartite-type tricarboxylate transporter receptor subunit TctC
MKSLIASLAIAMATIVQPVHAAHEDPAAYPSKIVKIIVPFAAGGGSDILARIVARELTQRLGQSVIVENRPGAGSSLGANAALKSPPDGYTLLLASSSYSVNPAIYKKLPFDTLNDMAPIIELGAGPMIVTVTPSLPVHTMKELIAYAHANPDKISFGSSGLGGLTHMCTESFMLQTQTKMVHVPYRGSSDVVPDLLTGRTQLFFADVGSVARQIAAGKLRGIAVSGKHRLSELPDVPTLSEAGFRAGSFGMEVWQGLLAPKGTPAPIIKRLNTELNQIIHTDGVIKVFNAQYYSPIGGAPQDFYSLIHSDMQRWSEVAKKANVQVD